MKIEALVEMNGGLAIVLDKPVSLIYKRIGYHTIYGTNGLFYTCYGYSEPTKAFQAFAGREFDIKLEDGEVVHANGQWWDKNQNIVEKELSIELTHIPVSNIESLRNCYVFTGYEADKDKIYNFIGSYDGPIYGYDEYDKILKRDKI